MAIENGYFGFTDGLTQHDLTVSISSNSDRILGIQLVVRDEASDVVSSVVLDPSGNNEAATQLQVGGAGDIFGSTWRIINATPGTDLILRVTTSAAVIMTISAVDMSGMDTTAIEDGYSVDTGTSSGPDAIFSTTVNGCHVQGSFMSEANSGASVDTWSGVTGQTDQDATDRGSYQSGSAYATQTSFGSMTLGFGTTQTDTWTAVGSAWPVGGGTLYYGTPSGALVSTGAVSILPIKVLAGSLVSSGTVASIGTFYRAIAGSLSSSGAVIKATLRDLAGSLLSSGTVAGSLTFVRSLAGALASSGNIAKEARISISGVLSSSGAVTSLGSFVRALGGTLASSGNVVKSIFRDLAGSMLVSGIITSTKMFYRTLTGLLEFKK